MHAISASSAVQAPPLTYLQADRIRRRIAASDAVAKLLAEMIYGPARRGDIAMLVGVTADRVAACQERSL